MTAPKPDPYGRYRVVSLETGHEYTSRRYIHGVHRIAGGPASDDYGRPIPAVPHVREPTVDVEPTDSPERNPIEDRPLAESNPATPEAEEAMQ